MCKCRNEWSICTYGGHSMPWDSELCVFKTSVHVMVSFMGCNPVVFLFLWTRAVIVFSHIAWAPGPDPTLHDRSLQVSGSVDAKIQAICPNFGCMYTKCHFVFCSKFCFLLESHLAGWPHLHAVSYYFHPFFLDNTAFYGSGVCARTVLPAQQVPIWTIQLLLSFLVILIFYFFHF